MFKIFEILKNIFWDALPSYVIFFVTSRCNAKCKMCFNWQNIDNSKHDNELSFEEIQKSFASLGAIPQLTISGGEPFLRKDLPKIVEFISRTNRVKIVTIPTNAILSDLVFQSVKSILENLPKTTHLRICLSVEGVGKKHDEIVQVKNAFESIIKTYDLLAPLRANYSNFNIDIGICVSCFNKFEVKELFDYASVKFPESSIQITLARGDTRDSLARTVSIAEYSDVLNSFYSIRNAKKNTKPFGLLLGTVELLVNRQVMDILKTNKMPGKCYAGRKLIVIQSNGDVFPCEYLGKSIGNLRNSSYDVPTLIKSKKNRKLRAYIGSGKCVCTWECALAANIIFNPGQYFKLMLSILRGLLQKQSF